jgi:diphthamide synthase (EF-2-diphthine--ammonia ligase)
MQGDPIVCSWSGGKDSCLVLWRAVQAGASVRCLATMFTEDGQRSRSHGLSRAVMEAQAAAIGVPLLSRAATWEAYEPAFVDLLCEAKEAGATTAIFGDIDIPRHRQWEERLRQAGLTAWLPSGNTTGWRCSRNSGTRALNAASLSFATASLTAGILAASWIASWPKSFRGPASTPAARTASFTRS